MSSPNAQIQNSIWTPIELNSGVFYHKNLKCQVDGISVNPASKFDNLFNYPLEEIVGVIYAYKYQNGQIPDVDDGNQIQENLVEVTFSPHRQKGNHCVTSAFLDILHNKNINVMGLDQSSTSEVGNDTLIAMRSALDDDKKLENPQDLDNDNPKSLNSSYHFTSFFFKNYKIYELDGNRNNTRIIGKIPKQVENDEEDEHDWTSTLVAHLETKIGVLDTHCAIILQTPDYEGKIERLREIINTIREQLNRQSPTNVSYPSPAIEQQTINRQTLTEKIFYLESRLETYLEKWERAMERKSNTQDSPSISFRRIRSASVPIMKTAPKEDRSRPRSHSGPPFNHTYKSNEVISISSTNSIVSVRSDEDTNQVITISSSEDESVASIEQVDEYSDEEENQPIYIRQEPLSESDTEDSHQDKSNSDDHEGKQKSISVKEEAHIEDDLNEDDGSVLSIEEIMDEEEEKNSFKRKNDDDDNSGSLKHLPLKKRYTQRQ